MGGPIEDLEVYAYCRPTPGLPQDKAEEIDRK